MNDDIEQQLSGADGAQEEQNAASAPVERSPVERSPAQQATDGNVATAATGAPSTPDSDVAAALALAPAGAEAAAAASPSAPAPTPTPTPAPGPRDPSDDITGKVADTIQQAHDDSDIQAALALTGGQEPGAGGAGATAPMPTPDTGGQPGATGSQPAPQGQEPVKNDTRSLGSKILLDVFHGTTQLPTEIARGVIDAGHSAMALAGELESFVGKHLPSGVPVGFDPIHHRFLYGDDLKNMAEADQSTHLLPAPDSVTGKMVEGISQFMTGFLAAGATGAAGAVSEAVGAGGKTAIALEGVVKAAMTDFTFFEGQTENLANLIQSSPKLANPVTEMFASRPGDPELLNRLKNTAAGALFGVGAEGLMKGFSKAVQFLREAGGSSAYGQIVAKWLNPANLVESTPIATKVQPFELATLGDPAKPTLLATKLLEGEEATKGIQPGDAIGQGPGYDINFAAINAPEDVHQTARMMAQREDARIAAGKGGTETHEMTNAKADQLNAFDVLAQRRQGAPLSGSEIVAGRRLYVSSATKLTQMAEIAARYPTPGNLFMFERMASIHSMVQKEVLNAASETGRALQALRIPVGDSESMAAQISRVLEDMGGEAGSLDKANKITKLAASEAGQAGVDKFVNGTAFKNVKDAIDQAYINGRFGQKTLVVKTISDFANMGYQTLLRKNAEIISQKLGTEGGVALGEATAMAHGWVSANKAFLAQLADNVLYPKKWGDILSAPRDAIAQVSKAKGGLPFELPPTGKIRAENFNIPDVSFLGKSLNVLFQSAVKTGLNGFNEASQVFGRGISLVDQYSKMVGYQMELHAQALRKATQEMPEGAAKDPAAFQDRIAEIVANPPVDIHLAAVNQATYQTFTGKPPEALKKLGDAIQSFPIVGRMILPFKTTPINIFTQAMEGSPMAPLLQSWRADLMAGGARADLATAKMATGMSLLQLSMDLGMKGVITGRGPEHPGERGNWERLGNQPYSVTLPNGDRLAYNRFEPHGYLLGMGADIAEAVKRADETVDDKTFMKVMVGGAAGVMSNVMSKSYLQGAVELISAMGGLAHGDTGPAERYIKSLIGTIPATVGTSAVTTLQQYLDPYARTADGMIDALWRKIPGLSKTLPLQRNLWGEPLDRSSELGAGYDAFSPYWLKTPNPQPVDQELERLKYYPSMPSHNVRDGGKTVELDGHQYDRLTELAGNALKDPARGNLGLRDYLNQLVTGKGAMGTVYTEQGKLDAQDGGDRQKTMIKDAIKSYQDKARAQLVGEDGKLQANIDAAHAGDRIHGVPIKHRIMMQGSNAKLEEGD